jgi:hypothetical protein
MFEFTITPKPSKQDTLHISKSNVAAHISLVRFIDKDTGHYVAYAPTLELSGYGENPTEAIEMFSHSVNDFFERLMKMKKDEVAAELKRYGWKKHRYRNKDFSALRVDINGKLKDMNAVENSVERLSLTA